MSEHNLREDVDLYKNLVDENSKLVAQYLELIDKTPSFWRIFKKREHDIKLNELEKRIIDINRKCNNLENKLFKVFGHPWLSKLKRGNKYDEL